jgi:hypothetical protein
VVLATHPLQLSRCVGGQLLVRIQMCTLLDDNVVGVVPYVEQVLCVPSHLRPPSAELRATEVASGLKALAPLRLLLITDTEQRNRRVSEASHAQGGECHVRHLLDDIINLTPNVGSCPRCCAFDRYLHPDLTTI